MKNAVLYKDIWLTKNSEAYEMYEKKSFPMLDVHLKLLDNKEKELVKRYKDSPARQAKDANEGLS